MGTRGIAPPSGPLNLQHPILTTSSWLAQYSVLGTPTTQCPVLGTAPPPILYWILTRLLLLCCLLCLRGMCMCVWWGGQNSGAWGTVLIGGGSILAIFGLFYYLAPPQLLRTGEYLPSYWAFAATCTLPFSTQGTSAKNSDGNSDGNSAGNYQGGGFYSRKHFGTPPSPTHPPWYFGM